MKKALLYTILSCIYFIGITTKATAQQKTTDKAVFMYNAHKKPMYAGCEESKDPSVCLTHKLNEYTIKHFEYPAEAKEKKIESRVFITFNFTKTGKVTIKNIMVVPNTPEANNIFKKAVTKLFANIPNVTPGEDENGNKIDVLYNYPLIYRLNTPE